MAARAKAGKATVYRRWSSKAELIVDAFVRDAFEALSAPDTGCLRSDLLALSEHMCMRGGPVSRASVMTGIMSAVLANLELRQAFQAASRPPDSVVSAVIRRAVDRGEIPEIPEPGYLEVVGAVMPSMCLFRLVKSGSPPDAQFFETVIDRIILPALRYRGESAAEGNADVRHL